MAAIKTSQSKPGGGKSSDVPVVDTTGILKIKNLCKKGSPLGMVLEEVLGMAKKVSEVSFVEVGGHASCVYDTKTEMPTSYKLSARKGNVGNLVHELIHVAVNEAYRADFTNLPPNPKANVPKRVFNDSGYCTNEADRQTSWMVNNTKKIEEIGESLKSLKRAAGEKGKTKGLSNERVKTISDQLLYGQPNPHKEYHTVITQILVWLYEWNCTENSFFKMLESHVGTAYKERQEARKQWSNLALRH